MIEFVEEDGKHLIRQHWKSGGRDNFGEEQHHDFKMKKANWDSLKDQLQSMTHLRPHWDQFPKSKIECKDNFEIMDKCKAQISFFNEYWVTQEEACNFRKDFLKATGISIFGAFPGTKVAALMEDYGILHLPIY